MYIVKVENKKQLEIVLKDKNIGEIILARDSFDDEMLPRYIDSIKKANKKSAILLERISRYEEIKDLRISTDKILEIANLDKIIIQNLDSFAYICRKYRFAKNKYLQIEFNYTMNCYNLETKKLYISEFSNCVENNDIRVDKICRFVAPLELNYHELLDVGYDTFVVYGYIDTMVTANCLYKNTMNDCKMRIVNNDKNLAKKPLKMIENLISSNFIKDRKNKNLYYKTYCKYCYNKIFNVEPLYLLDMKDDLASWGLSDEQIDYRIDFTIEDENEVRDILKNKIPVSFTRGHIKSSIK